MEGRISELRLALERLLDHSRDVHGETIEVDADLYWFVQREELNDPTSEPRACTLGSLVDGASEIAAIAKGEKDPVGQGLVWAAALLRALGDRTP